MERDNIIKALECCSGAVDDVLKVDCDKCPYDIGSAECKGLERDALAVIKELSAEKEAAVNDLKDCMYFAKPKRPNTCNFCEKDCEISKEGARCKGKDNETYCNPVWRGVVKPKKEGG